MEIKLEPHYRNYWLDLVRKEEKEIEEDKRLRALSQLMNTINQVMNKKKRKKP
jgi:hypothetical protein